MGIKHLCRFGVLVDARKGAGNVMRLNFQCLGLEVCHRNDLIPGFRKRSREEDTGDIGGCGCVIGARPFLNRLERIHSRPEAEARKADRQDVVVPTAHVLGFVLAFRVTRVTETAGCGLAKVELLFGQTDIRRQQHRFTSLEEGTRNLVVLLPQPLFKFRDVPERRRVLLSTARGIWRR